MRRIVKETLADGTIQYRVETNKMFFGLITCGWHTDTYYWGGHIDAHFDAVFSTLEEAEIHAYGKSHKKEILKREIISEK